MLLPSPRLAFLGPREHGWRLGGVGGQGCLVRHPSLLRWVRGCLSLAQSRAGESLADTGAGAGKERWGEGDQGVGGPRISCLLFRGPWSPGHVQRFKKGEWSNQFSDKAIYYPQSSWLFCLSCVTLEVGLQAGERQEWDAV